jgi:hypothetical protein
MKSLTVTAQKKVSKTSWRKKRENMFALRREISLKAFLITLTIGAMVAVVISVKLFDYETLIAELLPTPHRPAPLELEIREMVKGYPIESMAPSIAKQDPIVAAFLVSIAKKESNWGKRVPVLDGRDCYNYWGYRGKSEEMGTGGHTCFKSPSQAVTRVSKRIKTLVKEQKLDTPAEMIVWKCGSDCSGHSEMSVDKWIADVSFYFKQFKKNE